MLHWDTNSFRHFARTVSLLVFIFVIKPSSFSQVESLHIPKQTKIKTSDGSYTTVTKTETWNPKETAFIIIDMWDKHWCPTATARTAELAPFLNMVVTEAPKK